MTVEWVVAFLVGTLTVARVTRLVVDDDWPPVAWARRKWDEKTNTSSWNPLPHCPFCVSPYVAAADLTWAWLTDLQGAWWFVNVLLAGAYLAAIVNVRDIPEDQRG